MIIDNEHLALNEISCCLKKLDADILGEFTSPEDGYEFVMLNKPDAVFMSVGIPLFDGIELGIRIRAQMPEISLVFISSHPQYALESFRAHPDDFLLQPIDENRLLKTIKHICRNNNFEKQDAVSIPKIQCFGKFKVSINNEEVRFATQKTRELLAILICHYQKAIFKDELIGTLFSSGDEKKDTNNFRVTLYRLRHTFMEYNLRKEHLLIDEDYSIHIADGICDLIDFINFATRNKVINDLNIHKAQRIVDMINDEIFSDMDSLWLIDIREYLNIQLEELMLKTAQYYIGKDDKSTKAENILIKLLERNDLSEQGYEMLLDFYMMTANREKFLHLYRRYAKVLKIDLDGTPEREYTEYYIKCKK